MTQSIIASEEEFHMLCKFHRLQGNYDSFKRSYERLQLVYDHVQDEMTPSAKTRAFEQLYDFVSEANKDLIHHVGEMQAQFSHLEGYQESVSQVLSEILDEIEQLMSQMEPTYEAFMDAKFRCHKRSFGQAIASFFKGF